MPETPRFLLSQGKRREAEEALRFLRGPDATVEWECARIEDACEEQVSPRVGRVAAKRRGQCQPARMWFGIELGSEEQSEVQIDRKIQCKSEDIPSATAPSSSPQETAK